MCRARKHLQTWESREISGVGRALWPEDTQHSVGSFGTSA